MRFAPFFAEEKPCLGNETYLKSVARWRYHWRMNDQEKIHNMRKWVQSLCAPLRPFRSEVKEKFYHSNLPHILWMCTYIKKNILLSHYRVLQKLLSLTVPVVPKVHGRANICAHQKSINPCIL